MRGKGEAGFLESKIIADAEEVPERRIGAEQADMSDEIGTVDGDVVEYLRPEPGELKAGDGGVGMETLGESAVEEVFSGRKGGEVGKEN